MKDVCLTRPTSSNHKGLHEDKKTLSTQPRSKSISWVTNSMCPSNHLPTLVITVYRKPILAMQASSSTNLYESRSNLKSTGGGYMMERTRLPLAVEKPVRITTASTCSLPKYRVWITCVPQKRMCRAWSLASNGMSEFGNGVFVTGTLSPERYGCFLQTTVIKYQSWWLERN